MLDHQIGFSEAIGEIYKPISGRMSDADSFIPDGNPEGIRACEEYKVIVQDLKDTLAPELELIETRIIRPAIELLEVIKGIRKLAVKRDHKQIDYDRHRTALKKLQEKKDRNAKEERAMYKIENELEVATQEYNYFNDLLKDELPKLFALEKEFIRPLFQSFYYMQLNVFYTLHEKMQNIDIGYFNLTLGIEEAFEDKRGDIQTQAEALSITHFKAQGGRRPGQSLASKYGHRPAIGSSHTPLAIESSHRTSFGGASDHAIPPPYSPTVSSPATGASSPAAGGPQQWGMVAAAKAKPPPPKPKPSRLSGVPAAETCTALYDYEAQAEGDLSFAAGEVIEIVQRGASENEWWTGKIAGRQGQFPGEFLSCFDSFT